MPRSRYLDPAVLAKIDRLEIRARTVVEGFISGHHRSPFHGFSVEFADYRGYSPGDDLRHVDWRTYARSERYYVKQYELETNMICHVLLDVSESMAYHSRGAAGGMNKLEYGKLLAASLAFLVSRQADAVGLALFDEKVETLLRHSSKGAHVHQLCELLESVAPARQSDIGGALRDLSERITKRGLIVLISDLFDDTPAVADGLQRLRLRGHEVVVLHLLDHYELTFPFEGSVQFLGLETGAKVLCHPRLMRRMYLEEFGRFLDGIRRAAMGCGADYCRIDTHTGPGVALTAYLAGRERLLRKGRSLGGHRR